MNIKAYSAECLGTFVLTLFGCGSAAIAGKTLGTLGIALAFGLSIVAMAFVIGNVSGCHVNPAVSFGCFLEGRMSAKDLIGYWIGQFIGGILAAIVLVLIISCCGMLGGVASTGLGCDGFDGASAVGLNAGGAFLVEVILTFVFVFTILGVTADNKTTPFAGLVIGLTLTFVHIMGIPLTGTSVNPARSFGPALLMQIAGGNGLAMSQVWVFILAPLMGAALAAFVYKGLIKAKQDELNKA